METLYYFLITILLFMTFMYITGKITNKETKKTGAFEGDLSFDNALEFKLITLKKKKSLTKKEQVHFECLKRYSKIDIDKE